jgi:hypothetical protein
MLVIVSLQVSAKPSGVDMDVMVLLLSEEKIRKSDRDMRGPEANGLLVFAEIKSRATWLSYKLNVESKC